MERHPAHAPVIELDVREELRDGGEPFARIMTTVAMLHENEVLHLRAIFEPVPLFHALGGRGFHHESLAHAEDDWSVWFWRSQADSADSADSAAPRSPAVK